MAGAAMGAGAGLSLIGTGMQMTAAAKAAQEMFDVFKRYQSMAGQQQRAGMAEWSGSLPGYTAPAASRMPLYQQIQAVPLAYGMQPNRADATGYDMLAGNRADLMQYGDDAFMRALNMAKTQRGLDYRTILAGGQQSVMPYSMYKAQHSKDALALAGQLIAALGGSSANVGALFGAPSTQGWGQGQFSAPYSNPAIAPEMYGPGMM